MSSVGSHWRRISAALLAIAIGLNLSGCAGMGSWNTAGAEANSDTVAGVQSNPVEWRDPGAGQESSVALPADVSESRRPMPAAGTSGAESTEIEGILDQLDTIAELDAPARRQLIEDLRQTKPTLWPAMIHQFRAALAYRKQLERQGDQTAALQHASRPPAVFPEQPLEAAQPTANQDPGMIAPGSLIELPVVSATQASAAAATANESSVGRAAAIQTDTPASGMRSSPSSRQTAAATTVEYHADSAAAAQQASWNDHLSAAIRGLEQSSLEHGGEPAAAQQRATLRLLYLAAGRRDDALRPLEGITANEEEFWSKELFGLSAFLDGTASRKLPERAAVAAIPLGEAVDRLADVAPLQVQRLAFCTEVTSFGVYKPFERNEFSPGQDVLLYAEVENFRSDSTEKGFHTALRSRYEILDAGGRQVDAHSFALTEDYCRNRRHDFFMRYFVSVPSQLPDGDYTLQLLIEDTLAGKIGQGSIPLAVKRQAR